MKVNESKEKKPHITKQIIENDLILDVGHIFEYH